MTSKPGFLPEGFRGPFLPAAVLLLTCISFFWFPGHSILVSDTQIYIPILEHLANPAVLARDPMAAQPHVAYTIYDETALSLQRITGAGFESILLVQQFVLRAAGIAGLLLLAGTAGLSPLLSFAAAAIVSLGAVVAGPTVLTVEYEPVPRGFALPLVFLSLGLLARQRSGAAAAVAALAWAFHPPTVMPYWLLLLGTAAFHRRWRDAVWLLAGPLLISLSAVLHPASGQNPGLFWRVEPWLEEIQRMRASYNWADTWLSRYALQYLVLFSVAVLAAWRLRHRLPGPVMLLLAALPVIGILSAPLSWLLLDKLRWGLMPQYQPARYLVFVTWFAAFGGALAGLTAARDRRFAEAFGFLLAPFLLPLSPELLHPSALHLALAVLLALAASAGRFGLPVAAALGAFALYPTAGKVVNFARVDSPELRDLVRWAETSTSSGAIFQFADVRRGLEPGVLRARARRAVYADWKAGGQVNFLPDFAREWSERWKLAERPKPLPSYRDAGIDYVVFSAAKAPKRGDPVFSNAKWKVYRMRK